MDNDLRLEFRSDPQLLQVVRSVTRSYLAALCLAEERCDAVVLALDEACANAIRHSYGNRVDQRIFLAFRADDDWVELVLNDEGCTAPPEKVRRKPASVPDPETVKPGGLGVQLMYDVFDEVAYAPGMHRGNCVTMRLRRSKE
jgi:serine/threonine-protein kinase RsbW